MESKTIIFIRGCIGAGKETLMKYLESFGYCYYEPLSFMLPLLCINTPESIHKLQYLKMYGYCDILMMFIESNFNYIFIEGSPWDDYIFAHMSIMSTKQLITYDKFYNKILLLIHPFKHISIYLDVDPVLCKDRIIQRSIKNNLQRGFEKNISMKYLFLLYKKQHNISNTIYLINNNYDDMFFNISYIKDLL